MPEILKITILCMTALLITLGVLLSLPRSRLRSIFSEGLGWGAMTANGALLASPLDLIPLVPLDDVFYLAGIVLCALLIRHERHLRSAYTADPFEGRLAFPDFEDFEKEMKSWRPKTVTTRQSKSSARVPEGPRD